MKKKIIALLVICCIIAAMAVAVNAEDADFYYWNYEETLDDVGGRLDLAGKDPSGELDAVYNDGVISGTSCVDMTASRFALVTLDRAVNSFSFASWFYLPSEYANRFSYTTLFSIGAFDVPESFVHSFFEARGDGTYNFCIWLGATGAAVAQVATDGWHHAGWTYNAQTQTAKVYLDGVLVYDQVLASAFTGVAAGTAFYIGHQPVQWLFTDTRIDETVFAPSVWSEAQIKALYSDPAKAAGDLSAAFAPVEEEHGLRDFSADKGDHLSYDQILVNGNQIANGNDQVIANKQLIDGSNGDIQSITMHGWFGNDNSRIASYGYRIDGGDPVYGEWAVDCEPQVIEAGGESRYTITVDVSGLKDGAVHKIEAMVKLENGDIVVMNRNDNGTKDREVFVNYKAFVEQAPAEPTTEPVAEPTTAPVEPTTEPAVEPHTQTGDAAIAVIAVIAVLAIGAAVVFAKKRSF